MYAVMRWMKHKQKTTMASLLEIKRMGTILERKTSSQRMKDRDTAGGRIHPHKAKVKHKEHFRKDWAKDLWD